MMPQPIYIPGSLKQAIIQHINKAISKAVAAYGSAAEEEDASGVNLDGLCSN
jgi:hypothetical protein